MAEVSRYYVGYPASGQLLHHARHYIMHMQATKPARDTEALTVTLRLLVSETIDIYLMDLCRCQELRGVRKKLLDCADKTLKATANGVIKQVAKKLDAAQQQQIARHIESCLLPLQRDNLHEVALIACPVEGAVYERLRTTNVTPMETELPQMRTEVLARQKLIFNTMADYMVERLIVLIKLGPIHQRIVRTAIDKSISLTHTTFEKMIATMDRQDLQNMAHHMDELLISV